MAEQAYPVRRGRLARTAPLVGLAGRTMGEAVVATLRGKDRAQVHARSAERYVEMLGRSRGVLMKAGQILSFVTLGPQVRDEYRTLYQSALARLQDDAPPMAPELAASVVAAELGSPPEKVFASFDPVPIAAASIGQVHAARLADGRRVAVKIQYPGVEEAIRADLANTELLATFFQLIRGLVPEVTRVDVRSLAREVAERIGEEIDYRTEAANQAEFADAYRGHPFIRIPEVVPELSTRRVFVMELVDGLRWSAARSAGRDLLDRWGEIIYRFSFGSLRRLGLFNADPHPGNYLFHPDGTVTFLDFGCVKRFSRSQIRWMQAVCESAVDSRADDLFALLVEGGLIDPADPPAPAEVLAWFRESLRPLVGPQPFTYTPEYAASVVQSEFSPLGPFSSVVRKLTMPPHYLFLMRIDLGVTSVLGALGTTGPWEAIRHEYDRAGPPGTPLGEQDLAFWKSR
ncbi:MAG TPA: AarF/ABC1/UbiB kinase family protein [Actinophytocola sp.]|uniref:ABC1 kinase family protein n=1 Tax=Actinophytocola sp. TaxID=1872138 RepID=UPI002DDCC77A|nr:AarF/ABC1/UbiB kinase family protein [Actinophytocola sp.]HEV2782292.1 AarF/ABC1/UbiB kinase family protein [Actinophytocola sp.]